MVHALQHAQTALLVQPSSPRYLRSTHISYTDPSSIANPRRVYFPGVRPDHALGVDEAALNFRSRPALFDCAVCALAAVDDGDEWGFDAFKQQLVVAGGFVFAPVPGDHVVDGRRDDQAATGGVGAIEKYLVVDPLVVAGGGVRHINEPAPLEAPLHGGAANTVSFG